jgi:hypothetical protein
MEPASVNKDIPAIFMGRYSCGNSVARFEFYRHESMTRGGLGGLAGMKRAGLYTSTIRELEGSVRLFAGNE